MNLFKKENENEYQYIWRICKAKDEGLIDFTWNEIADILNRNLRSEDEALSESVYRKKYQQAKLFYENVFSKFVDKENEIEDFKNVIHNSENSINKDGTFSSVKTIQMNEEQSRDTYYILKAHGFNPELWDIVSVRNNSRQVINKNDEIVTMYNSYLTVKPIKNRDISLEHYETFFDNLDRNYSVPKIKKNYSYLNGDKLLLIDIADLHLNLQASVFTSGNEYNCKIAEKLFFEVINDILTRTSHYNFKEIIFCVGGDMLNADNLLGTTTKGTPQNNDLNFYDAYEKLCSMTIRAIDMLKDICKVNVIYIMGNHDEITGFKLAKYIDAWFRNEEMVTVDYTPLPRKYFKFGKTLLCFAHDGNVKDLPALIADEAREYWSDVTMTEVFLQHLHSESVLKESNNIRIQRLPTISAKSKWSNDCGYNSKRQCKTFVFDIEDGLQDILYTSI